GGFTGTGRAGNQNNAVGFQQSFRQTLMNVSGHGQLFKLQLPCSLIQQPQYDALTESRRNSRHPDINRMSGEAYGNTSILRQALFGDIEARHYLQARNQYRGQL